MDVEDQGEYVCRAHNDKVSITGSVKISIQSRPMFTIAIGDKHVDEKTDVTWTCEVKGCQMAIVKCLDGMYVFGPSGLKDYGYGTLRCKI